MRPQFYHSIHYFIKYLESKLGCSTSSYINIHSVFCFGYIKVFMTYCYPKDYIRSKGTIKHPNSDKQCDWINIRLVKNSRTKSFAIASNLTKDEVDGMLEQIVDQSVLFWMSEE